MMVLQAKKAKFHTIFLLFLETALPYPYGLKNGPLLSSYPKGLSLSNG
jgi:hypothetical protein